MLGTLGCDPCGVGRLGAMCTGGVVAALPQPPATVFEPSGLIGPLPEQWWWWRVGEKFLSSFLRLFAIPYSLFARGVGLEDSAHPTEDVYPAGRFFSAGLFVSRTIRLELTRRFSGF